MAALNVTRFTPLSWALDSEEIKALPLTTFKVDECQSIGGRLCEKHLLVPSSVETFGNVTLETMASGLLCSPVRLLRTFSS
jgi:hypothetical protein